MDHLELQDQLVLREILALQVPPVLLEQMDHPELQEFKEPREMRDDKVNKENQAHVEEEEKMDPKDIWV